MFRFLRKIHKKLKRSTTNRCDIMLPRAISLPDFFDVVPRSNVTTPTKSTLEMQKANKRKPRDDNDYDDECCWASMQRT